MRYAAALTVILTLALPASADTLDEYLEKIKAARESVAAALEDHSRAGEAARRLSELQDLPVTGPGGDTFSAPNQWAGSLSEDIRTDTSGLAAREALSKLDAIAAQAEELRQSRSLAVDAQLPTGEEFGEGALKPTVRDRDIGIRERLRQLAELLRPEPPEPRPASRASSVAISPGTFWVIVLIIIGVVVAIIAYQIVKNRPAKPPSAPRVSRMRGASVLEDALKRTPEQWKELAREYFAKGDFTQAVRALYLGLLVVLHRRRLISYDTAKTNWEYVWEVSPGRMEHKPFEALTSAFDYKWYGRKECTRAEYLNLERMADTIVEQNER